MNLLLLLIFLRLVAEIMNVLRIKPRRRSQCWVKTCHLTAESIVQKGLLLATQQELAQGPTPFWLLRKTMWTAVLRVVPYDQIWCIFRNQHDFLTQVIVFWKRKRKAFRLQNPLAERDTTCNFIYKICRQPLREEINLSEFFSVARSRLPSYEKCPGTWIVNDS